MNMFLKSTTYTIYKECHMSGKCLFHHMLDIF